jgi:transposase
MKWTAELLEPLRGAPERLIEIVLNQARQFSALLEQQHCLSQHCAALQEEVRGKDERILRLEALLAEAQRSAARQAAPFRLAADKRNSCPKRPGRKGGHRGVYRPVPPIVDEHIQVPLQCPCPHCGQWGGFVDQRELVQYIEELPPVRPHVTRLVTWEALCSQCRNPVRSTHPLQVSLASGAAGVHLGARAQAVAIELNKKHGLTVRKTCGILHDLFGLHLSPGGLSKAGHRLAKKLQPQYEQLALQLRRGPVVHADETSWWVGGPGWWLWVFCSATLTFYLVIKSRGRSVVNGVLDEPVIDVEGATVCPERSPIQPSTPYGGVLVSDCLPIYDDSTPYQQKCYSHHLRAVKEAIQQHPQQGEGFLLEVRAMLKDALGLKQSGRELKAEDYAQQRSDLEARANQLLATPRSEPHEERVRARLSKQRDHLFTFLYHQEVDATNNLAERQLRPAVIARKLSCGNKTQSGALTWQVLTSLAATAAQRKESFLKLIMAAAARAP